MKLKERLLLAWKVVVFDYDISKIEIKSKLDCQEKILQSINDTIDELQLREKRGDIMPDYIRGLVAAARIIQDGAKVKTPLLDKDMDLDNFPDQFSVDFPSGKNPEYFPFLHPFKNQTK